MIQNKWQTYVGLLLSVLLHASLFYSFHLSPPIKPPDAINIEITNELKPTTTLNKKDSQSIHKKNQSLLAKKLLSSPFNFQPAQSQAPSANDPSNSRWGSGSGGAHFSKNLEGLSILQRIYRDLDGLVYYPAVLASHKQEGGATARLVFGKEGKCDWSTIEISSNNSHFRIFILDTLKKFCRQTYTLPTNTQFPFVVDMSFLFEITERNDQAWRDSKNIIVGNVLHFYRNSHQGATQWRLGPLTGLFPIPFIQLDFNWLKENWESYIENKDPLKEFREP